MDLNRKRYAIIGTGSRAAMYIDAISGKYANGSVLVALCDKNLGRMEYYNNQLKLKGCKSLPTYLSDDFSRLIEEQKPDTVIIASGPDSTHADYIVTAMRLGCDVITEKPLTIDEDSCQRLILAQKETGRKLRVAFNYRYAPSRAQVKKLLLDGEIGSIISVEFSWFLNTRHGADYFRRWHRRMENSGSLLIHKATHHFDLVNWWLNDTPEEVSARGELKYYNEANANRLGLLGHSDRCLTCPKTTICPFYLNLREGKLKDLYLEQEHYDNYQRDKCVFSDEITIYDTMSAHVHFESGVLMSYTLNAFSPIEGYRIVFNGTKGRIEHNMSERSYISGDGSIPGELIREKTNIVLTKEFSEPEELSVHVGKGGHAGGDPLLLEDIFGNTDLKDPLAQRANYIDGVKSVLVGVGALKSIESKGIPIRLMNLLK